MKGTRTDKRTQATTWNDWTSDHGVGRADLVGDLARIWTCNNGPNVTTQRELIDNIPHDVTRETAAEAWDVFEAYRSAMRERERRGLCEVCGEPGEPCHSNCCSGKGYACERHDHHAAHVMELLDLEFAHDVTGDLPQVWRALAKLLRRIEELEDRAGGK